MKATKYTLNIRARALHRDSLKGMLQQIIDQLNDVNSFDVSYTDGDDISWGIETEEVTF